MATEDGPEHQMDVSAEGSGIPSGLVADDEDAADEANHQSCLAAAKLDLEEAAEAMLLVVPNGLATELILKDDAGSVVWEGGETDDAGS